MVITGNAIPVLPILKLPGISPKFLPAHHRDTRLLFRRVSHPSLTITLSAIMNDLNR